MPFAFGLVLLIIVLLFLIYLFVLSTGLLSSVEIPWLEKIIEWSNKYILPRAVLFIILSFLAVFLIMACSGSGGGSSRKTCQMCGKESNGRYCSDICRENAKFAHEAKEFLDEYSR